MFKLKKIFFLAVLMFAFPFCSDASIDLSTPKATFKAVVKAVQDKDIKTYKKCFSDGAIKKGEAMIKKFDRNPDAFWSELQGIFKGPQSIDVKINGNMAKGSVTAPEAQGGGIGGMSFEKVGDQWKIRGW